MADVEEFAQVNDLNDILDELKKGALVARDPSNFDTMPQLDAEEKAALTKEVTHKWAHTRTLYITIITCSIGAAVQGWDQTGSNGANLSFPDQFGIGTGSANPPLPTSDRDNWLVGLVNAAPYIASSLIGCWVRIQNTNGLQMLIADFMHTALGSRKQLLGSSRHNLHDGNHLVFNTHRFCIHTVLAPALRRSSCLGLRDGYEGQYSSYLCR